MVGVWHVFGLVALGIGLLLAVVDWIAVWLDAKGLRYIFKPATLVAIIVGGLLLTRHTGGPYLALWFLPALGFSLLGDIFLMLPEERWFPLGLGAFLVAQLCYIIGLNPTLPPPASLWLLGLILVIDLLVLPPVVRGARAGGDAALQIPVVIYGVILSMTLFSGWATWFRSPWPTAGRLAVSAGTTLFFASDLMLAWNKFVRKSRALEMGVIVTYHLAQIALALTIWLHTVYVGGYRG
jgi:alkenylglycerophosphocholine hydrolase